jgi:hypothetical protein
MCISSFKAPAFKGTVSAASNNVRCYYCNYEKETGQHNMDHMCSKCNGELQQQQNNEQQDATYHGMHLCYIFFRFMFLVVVVVVVVVIACWFVAAVYWPCFILINILYFSRFFLSLSLSDLHHNSSILCELLFKLLLPNGFQCCRRRSSA